MMKESEYRSKIIEKKKIKEPLAMTKKDHEYFKNFTKYWICKKSYEDGEMTVKNHNHISGKC